MSDPGDQSTAVRASRHSGSTVPAGGTRTVGVPGSVRVPVPRWFAWLIVIVTSGVVSFGSIGVVLAVRGDYSAGLVYPLAIVATIVLVVLGRPRRAEYAAEDVPAGSFRRTQLPALLAGVFAVGAMAVNALKSGTYVYVDRDPGVYAVGAKWIALHGTLEVPGCDAFGTAATKLTCASAGMYIEQGQSRLEFQFSHYIQVLMAEAYAIGHDRALFAVPAVLGGLGLLAIYAVATRLVANHWYALAAVVALGVSLPQVWISRDPYSETSTQVLAWVSIVALLRLYRTPSISLGLFTGLAIGATSATRVDQLLFLVPVPLLFAAAVIRSRYPNSPYGLGRAVRAIAAAVIGAAVVAEIGYIDAYYRAGGYLSVSLLPQFHTLEHALLASAVLAIVLVLVWPWLGRRSWLPQAHNRLISALPILTVALLAALWWIRPVFLHARQPGKTVDQLAQVQVISGLQTAEHLSLDPLRSYADQTMNWMSWYLGPVALVLAIIGLALLVRRALSAPADPAALVVLAVLSFVSLLYIWSPNITPDQLFAIRRFVPATLPLLAVSAMVGLESLVGLLRRTEIPAVVMRVVPAFVIAVVFLGALGPTIPMRGERSQYGFLPVIRRTCAQIGPNAAVVFAPGTFPPLTILQTLRSWCNVPVAREVDKKAGPDLTALAATFRQQGRTLWVLGGDAASVTKLVGPSHNVALLGSAVSTTTPQRTLSRPPQAYTPLALQVFGVKLG